MKLTIKTRWTGIPVQQARDIAAPWTDTLVYDSYNVLLRSRWTGIPSQQAREINDPWSVTSVYDTCRWNFFFYAQILEANEVYYFFTSNNNLEQLEQQQFFQ